MSKVIIKQKRHISKDVLSVNIVGYVVIGIFALLCLLPFYLIIVASFTDEASLIRNGYPLIPTDVSIQSYLLCLKNPIAILKAYGTTIGITVVGTCLSVLLSTMTGYVLSRQDFPWRNKFSFFFFFTTLFSGGLVPWYMMCVRYLNFKNSYIAIILPLSKPLIATLSLFSALAYWNDWYNCMLFMSTGGTWNLQYTLQNILNSSEALKRIASMTGMQVGQVPTEGLKLSMTVIATGPIILLYPFLQKYFVKGMTIGAVKG